MKKVKFKLKKGPKLVLLGILVLVVVGIVGSKIKEDIAQYDPQAAVATEAYAKLAQAGKIGK
mgnify:CR=1 FL=1